MSKNDGAGGTDPNSGGAGSDDKSKDTVSFATYSKVMDELKALQTKAKTFEDEKKASEEAKLKEANDWKKLYEQRDTELKETKESLTSFQKNLNDSIKISAFNRHLGGKLKNDSYIDFVKLEDIAINPETRKVDAESVKKVVASFLKEHSPLVEFKGGGKLPGDSANGLGPKGASSSGKTVTQMSTSELEADIIARVKSGEIQWT